MEKLCKTCGKLKTIDNFWKHDKMADGYRNECKECSNKKENKERRRELNLEKEIKTDGVKVCRLCNIEKDINEFHIKRGTFDGHRSECKECMKIVLKKYKEEPGFKEKEKEYDKKRYDELREQILQRKKEYHLENREKILSYKKEYHSTEEYKIQNKQWRKENKDLLAQNQANYRKKYPHIIAWRSVLYSTLKRLNTLKEGHTIDMLGYSALELKHHIENKFLPGM